MIEREKPMMNDNDSAGLKAPSLALTGPEKKLLDGGKITDREWDIIELYAVGKSTGMIGKILGVSPKTVETYRGILKKKMGIRSAGELYISCYRMCVVSGGRSRK